MSTIEKLIVQIFERKNSIIEQVKHQVELYDQQLASKLVIQGIDPLSWLWNHEAPSRSSDRSEIVKQRLISELLLPHPQQAGPYFNNINFNSINLPECNFNQQDEPISPTCFDDVHNLPDISTEMGPAASSPQQAVPYFISISIPECNFNQEDEPTSPNCFDDVHNVPNISTEVGPAASSPQQQVATRLDDDNSGLDLSCVEFKRSTSRQRALVLRSRSKNAAKSRGQAVSGKILCSSEDGVSKGIPRQQCNNEMDSTKLDICCTSNIAGVGSGGQIDESSTEEILFVAHGNCSTDATLDVHRLSSIGEVPIPSGISCSYAANKDNEIGSAVSFSSWQDHPRVLESLDLMTCLIIGDSNSGMMKVQTKGPSSSDKTLTNLSANPVKTKILRGGNSELVRNFPAAENDGSIGGVSLSCNLSQSHDHLLQSLQPASPAVNIASTGKESDDCASSKNSPKSSGVKSEVRASSCCLEDGNSLLEELNAPEMEVEVPRMQSATVEQSDQQKEDANLAASDYPLINGAVQNQESIHRVRSVSGYGTSKVTEDSYHFQDNVEVEENSEGEASPSLQKATTSSFSKILGKVETESLMLLSHEAKKATDDSMMNGKSSKCFMEGSHLFLDVEANLNEEHYDHETFSIENALGGEPYAEAFEESAFIDVKYDGMMKADQSMPVFERFVMEPDDDESIFAEGQIDIKESSCNLRRASVLERLCQSSSRNTPVSQFPMTYGLHKTSGLFQSVPTGLLEHISQLGDCTNIKLQHKSHSACQSVSTDPFSFNVSTPYASPFIKKWDRGTSSSGPKSQGSLNPELVCFTIEEDPGNCDEIGNQDEAAEAPPSHSSCSRSSLKRKPLTDITEDGNNPHLSVSVKNKNVLEAGQTPKFCFKSQLDSTCTEANVTGTQTKAGQKLGKEFSNKKRRLKDTKENRNVSVGANGDKQVTCLLKETKYHKPKYSENLKTTTGASEQQKVLRSNNILSNVSSFIPLVQQKKAAAAVVTGNRDVKVKALEAAEAAKRFAEKKENERKAKKEAWKAEKARLEQENLLQLELKKKKKEEELKKKEAEMAARKRIREEEEKKEKEGKRRRIEEARKQQQEQGKKQADKLIRHQADGLRIHGKDPNNGLAQCTKMETGGRKGRITIQSEVKATTVPCDMKTMLYDLKESNTLMKADIGARNFNSAVSDLNATAKKNPKDKVEVLQAYDISPYEGSDDEYEDEDDDDDDRRKEKFVPAWASKNSLAEDVFTQQHINPYKIFPPGSFCRISEALIPRKLLAK